MSTGFEKRYAGLTRDECQHTAILIMRHAVQTGKWDDLPERLLELRKIMAYAPVPDQGFKHLLDSAEETARQKKRNRKREV